MIIYKSNILKIFIFLFASTFLNVCNGQFILEEGYFIDNNNKETRCLIKNKNWRNNPKGFEFKLDKNSKIETHDINDIQEFGVDTKFRFKRFFVSIDKSSRNSNNLTYNEIGNFEDELVFLKTIIKGKIDLYSYSSEKTQIYFYSTSDNESKQLIYRKYKDAENRIKTIEDYKKQLWDNVKCDKITIKDLSKLTYSKKDLITYFEKFNACYLDVENEKYTEERSKNHSLFIKPGLRVSSYSIRNTTSNTRGEIDFTRITGYSIGVEAEFNLFRNSKNWSIILEPTYQSMKGVSDEVRSFFNYKDSISYKSLDMALGFRYSYLIPADSRIYATGLVEFNSPINSDIFNNGSPIFIITPGFNFGIGAGYLYKNKFKIDIRYGFNRELLKTDIWYSDYDYLSISIGYKLIKY